MACTPVVNRPLGDVCLCSGWGSNGDGTCNTSERIVGQDLFNYWCQNDCPTAYSTQLNDNNGVLQFNPNALPVVQSEISNLFFTFNLTNTITPDTLSSQYSPFQDTLLTTCLDERLPGVCAPALNSFCGQYSRNQIGANGLLTSFCGCYTTPDPAYASLTDFDPACDPLCHRATTVQTATGATINTCSNSVCAISDISVSLSQSEVGSINFSNVCPACPNDTCTCIISGVDVNQTLSNVGIGTQFNNLCGPNSLCFSNNTWGPCSPVPPEPGLGSWWPTIIIIGLILLAVFLILILYAIKGSKSNLVFPGIYTESSYRGPAPAYSYQLKK